MTKAVHIYNYVDLGNISNGILCTLYLSLITLYSCMTMCIHVVCVCKYLSLSLFSVDRCRRKVNKTIHELKYVLCRILLLVMLCYNNTIFLFTSTESRLDALSTPKHKVQKRTAPKSTTKGIYSYLSCVHDCACSLSELLYSCIVKHMYL